MILILLIERVSDFRCFQLNDIKKMSMTSTNYLYHVSDWTEIGSQIQEVIVSMMSDKVVTNWPWARPSLWSLPCKKTGQSEGSLVFSKRCINYCLKSNRFHRNAWLTFQPWRIRLELGFNEVLDLSCLSQYTKSHNNRKNPSSTCLLSIVGQDIA